MIADVNFIDQQNTKNLCFNESLIILSKMILQSTLSKHDIRIKSF